MAHPLTLPHRVILLHTESPENLGFCARAMKTMGLRKLALVGPLPQPWSRARLTAVHAEDILDGMELAGSLEELRRADRVLTAFSARHHGSRGRKVMDLEEWADLVSKRGLTVDLVFGPESHGLRREEVEACDWLVTIPTHPDQPSLNLSHAVQLATYALFRRGIPSRPTAEVERLRAWSREVVAFLREWGLFPYAGARSAERTLRALLLRAAPNAWESLWLEKQARDFAGIVRARARPGGPSDRPEPETG